MGKYNKGNSHRQHAQQHRGHRSRRWLDLKEQNSEIKVLTPPDPSLIEKNKEIIEEHKIRASRKRFGYISFH